MSKKSNRGRPSGSIICDHSTIDDRCRKNAKVVVRIRVKGALSTNRQQLIFRCWQHYLEIENAGRNSTAIKVISARLLKKIDRKRAR